MRLGDLDALKEYMDRPFWEKWEWEFICKSIDNAPTVSDRYDEGFRDGYAQCINDKEERKENSRLFRKGGAENDNSNNNP